MSRLRVLEVVASSRGGGAVHVRDLATNLAAERFQVTVAMPEDGGHVGRADFTSHGVAFEALPIASGFRLGALLALRRLAMRADILHLHGARAALFGRLAAASLGKRRPRVLYTIHGFAAPHYGRFRRTLLLGLERLLSRWTDTVVAVSASEREVFLTATGYPPGTVRVVWNGISLAPFQSLPEREALRQT
ncbi:MAG: glycosyltransferase, partial [Chloroflexi bacterium]|nr:glycosyltransferase [Chloroflexota bacterium]